MFLSHRSQCQCDMWEGVPSPTGKSISPGGTLACPTPAPHGAFDLSCEVIATPVSCPRPQQDFDAPPWSPFPWPSYSDMTSCFQSWYWWNRKASLTVYLSSQLVTCSTNINICSLVMFCGSFIVKCNSSYLAWMKSRVLYVGLPNGTCLHRLAETSSAQISTVSDGRFWIATYYNELSNTPVASLPSPPSAVYHQM